MSDETARRVLVTGGAKGVGGAIVRALVAQGFDVDFTYRASSAAAEALAAELETAHPGRSVRALALDLADAVREKPDGPDVRVGLAYGPILPVMGDVFGPTVNLAARLTAIARPGTIIVDSGMAEGLAGEPGLEICKIRRRPARGFGVIQPYVLRAVPPDREQTGETAGRPAEQASARDAR